MVRGGRTDSALNVEREISLRDEKDLYGKMEGRKKGKRKKRETRQIKRDDCFP